MSRDGSPPGVVASLARVAFLVNSAYAEAGRSLGITPQQGQLLCLLRPGGWGFGALVGALGLAKSTTSGLVDGVEARGFVRREPGQDSRSTDVVLTTAGGEVADRFYDLATSWVEAELAPLDAPAREALAGLLQPVVGTKRFAVIFPDPDEPPRAD